MNVIESLRTKAEAEAAKAETEWQNVVVRVAANEATEREVVAVLKATGKTVDDLQRDVGRARRIAELQGLVKMYPDAALALEQATTKAAEFNRERQLEFARNRDAGILIHGGVNEARANFENIRAARCELEGLLGSPVELPIGQFV